MKNKTVLAPAVKPAYTAEKFVEAYSNLVKQYGFQIAYEPKWAQSKDTGDYRLIISTLVIPVPKNDNV